MLPGDLHFKNFPGKHAPRLPSPPRGSGIQPSILQVTCPLTRQCPSTSKVNENPETGLLELEVEGGE